MRIFYLLLVTLFLFSCAPNKTGNFSQRKYLEDFKKVEKKYYHESTEKVTYASNKNELTPLITKSVLEDYFPKESEYTEASVPERMITVKSEKQNIKTSLNHNSIKSRISQKIASKVIKQVAKNATKENPDRNIKDVIPFILLLILCFLLPPLAVYLVEDELNTSFWISVILTLLFWVPGIIYALYVLFTKG